MKRVLVAVLVVSFIMAGLVSPACSSGGAPTPTPTPTLTLTPSGDFVTVDDSQRGVSYILPRNWQMASQEELNQVPWVLPSAALGEPEHEYAMIYVATVPMMAGLSLEEILKRRSEQINIDSSQPNPLALQPVVVDKYPGFRLDYALKLDYASARAIEVWFMRNDLVFQVFAFATVDKFPDYESIFEKVISSFKLTSGG